MDNLTKEQRSINMSRIRSKKGKPDLYLKKYNLAIFIHGCFWHKHGCRYSVIPKSNRKYWEFKLKNNTIRDEKNLKILNQIGIKYKIIWECQIKEQIEKEVKRVIMRTTIWILD